MPNKSQIKQAILDVYKKEREEWIDKARGVAYYLAAKQGSVCADDIHKMCPPPKGVDPRTMGSIFTGMKFIGYIKSSRSVCHHRVICNFTLGENYATAANQ